MSLTELKRDDLDRVEDSIEKQITLRFDKWDVVLENIQGDLKTLADDTKEIKKVVSDLVTAKAALETHLAWAKRLAVVLLALLLGGGGLGAMKTLLPGDAVAAKAVVEQVLP